MSSKENPIVLLKREKEKAMGFFLNLIKRVQQKDSASVSGSAQQVVGIDLGHAHLLVVAIERKADKTTITNFRLEQRPPSPDAASELLRNIFKEENLSPLGVRIAIKGQGVVVRTLSFPQMRKKDLAGAIGFEIEKYIPFKANEVIFDFQILNENILRGNAKYMETLLVATKQAEVYSLLRVFQNADIQVDIIDVGALAINNFMGFLEPETLNKPTGFLDMGAESSTFVILYKDKPVFIRDISFGGADLLKIIKRKFGFETEGLSLTQVQKLLANPEHQKALEERLGSFFTELKLSMGYYLDHVSGAEAIQTLFLSGGGFRMISNLAILERELKISVRKPNTFSKFIPGPHLNQDLLKENEDLLPVALGLCLR
ncbi:MAG: type IV pilus assembly protein PilM [Candidatus Omnitrophica bacterium]|nr:type IV pilus assembly protein PilM [Candidatus Omnitrophota bacterium]